MSDPDSIGQASPGLFWPIRRVLRRNGLLGTARLAWSKAVERVASRSARRKFQEHEQRFDRTYNIDTAGVIRPEALGVRSAAVQFASQYRGIDPDLFQDVLQRLDIDCPRFSFVDLGSGKGRAVLLASKWPFRKVIGVEFSPQLHRVACDNARRFPAGLRRCNDIEFACCDAAGYDLPAGNLVLFFYNPFEQAIFDRVTANIERSLARQPRTIYLVLANVPFPVRPAGFAVVPLPVEGPMPVTVLRAG